MRSQGRVNREDSGVGGSQWGTRLFLKHQKTGRQRAPEQELAVEKEEGKHHKGKKEERVVRALLLCDARPKKEATRKRAKENISGVASPSRKGHQKKKGADEFAHRKKYSRGRKRRNADREVGRLRGRSKKGRPNFPNRKTRREKRDRSNKRGKGGNGAYVHNKTITQNALLLTRKDESKSRKGGDQK